MQSTTITSHLNNHLTYYTSGQGPLLVIINAYGVPIEPWEALIEILAKSFKVVTWELRGIKDQDKPETDFKFGIAQHTQDLADIIDDQESQQAHLVAWCSGIKPAIEYYQLHPDKVASMTSIAGNFTPFTQLPSCKTEWDDNMTSISQMFIDQPDSLPIFFDVISNSIDEAMNGDGEIKEGQFGLLKLIKPEYINQILKPMFSQESMANYLHMINDYYKHDISDKVTELKMPLLLIVASDDGIANPQQSHAVSEILPSAKIESIPDSNHYMMIENATQVSDKISAFINAIK